MNDSLLLRIGFVKDKINYIPSHDTLLWYFIELYLLSKKIIDEQLDRVHFMSRIITGGPYEAKYGDETVSKLVEDYDRITVLFKETQGKEEDHISFEELDDLMSSLQ